MVHFWACPLEARGRAVQAPLRFGPPASGRPFLSLTGSYLRVSVPLIKELLRRIDFVSVVFWFAGQPAN